MGCVNKRSWCRLAQNKYKPLTTTTIYTKARRAGAWLEW
jgi:hypothetical protein